MIVGCGVCGMIDGMCYWFGNYWFVEEFECCLMVFEVKFDVLEW